MEERVILFQSAKLESAGFRHGFPARPFDFGVKVAPEAAAANLRRLGEAVGFDPTRSYLASQVHGARVLRAAGDPEAVRREEADALVAEARSGVTVGVRVADCVPLLVGDEERGAAAAIHAGWRGIVAGVVRAAVEAMDAASPRGLVAAIGPCIGPCCFEVGADVADPIAKACGDPRVIARRDSGPDKAYVDLRRAARAQLVSLGVPADRIEDVGGCTRCDEVNYFSYRRDAALSGRHLCVIRAR